MANRVDSGMRAALVMTAAGAAANIGVLAFGAIAGRVLGPAGLADIGRLLSIEFGLLSLAVAFQQAFAQFGAAGADCRRAARRFAAGWAALALPIVLCLVALWWWLATPPAGRVLVFLTLALSVPFVGALVAARGLALGGLQIVRFSASAVIEAAARIALVILLFAVMDGALSVAVAAALSIPAGWLVLLRRTSGTGDPAALGRVCLAAMPWLGLQAGQMAILEGDIFWASLFMAEPDAGRVALVTTLQRFQFLTAVGLASYVVPTLAGAGASGVMARFVAGIALLLVAINAPFLVAAVLVPAEVAALVGGAAFADVAGALLPASIGTTAFTVAYVALSALCARGHARIALVLWGGILLEGAILWVTPESHDPAAFYRVRALALGLLAAVTVLVAFYAGWRRGAQRKGFWANA